LVKQSTKVSDLSLHSALWANTASTAAVVVMAAVRRAVDR
jgi:hypothetical protein